MVHFSKNNITLSFVGDIALGEHPLCIGHGLLRVVEERGCAFIFQAVKPYLQQSQITFGNLEYAILKRLSSSHLAKSKNFCPQECLEEICHAGFDILNLANNHIMEHGEKAAKATMKYLFNSGIKFCGIHSGNPQLSEIVTITCHHMTIGFLGYSLRPRQFFKGNPIYSEGDYDRILTDIEDSKKKVNILIVSLHWGDEFIQKPSPQEILNARSMIDAGANIIVGHHPHVVRGIEVYKGGIIAYSLGNFICDMSWEERLIETMILQVHISEDCNITFDIIPCKIDEYFRPVLLEGLEADKLKQKIIGFGKGLNGYNIRDLDKEQRLYELESKRQLKLNQMSSRMYFLKHLNDYPAGIVCEHFILFLKNRFQEWFSRV